MAATQVTPMKQEEGQAGKRTPGFLGIGSMRCGTSWLHSMLKAHPQISMPHPKQPNYFDKWYTRRSVRWYLSQWDDSETDDGVGDGKLRGEISTGYCKLGRPAVRRVRACLGEVPIVLCVRNPVERTWSQALYEIVGPMPGGDPEAINGWRLLAHIESRRVDLYNNYLRAMRHWSGVFGQKALHVAIYDELVREPKTHLEAVLRHLGIDEQWRPDDPRLHERVLPTPKAAMPDAVRSWLAQRLLPGVERFNRALDGRVEEWVHELKATDPLPSRWRTRQQVIRGLIRALEWPMYDLYEQTREMRRVVKNIRIKADWERHPSEAETLPA